MISGYVFLERQIRTTEGTRTAVRRSTASAGVDGATTATSLQSALELAGLASGTGDHNDLVVRIAQPHLAVSWSRIDKRSVDDHGGQFSNTVHGRIEVRHLEPQHDTVNRGALHRD